jgi:tetratricopeptide (TPR) repeat protein
VAEASAPREEAAALIGAGRTAEARALLRTALAASPDDAQLHYLLGAAHHAAGDPVAALAAFDRAATLEPKLLAARQGRAAMLLALGRTDAALAESAAIVESFPGDAQNLANHALLLLQVRADPAAAVTLWDRALAIAPDLAPALVNRGHLLLQLGRTPAALASARAFVAAHPADPRAHAQLGEALLASGEYGAALPAIDRALGLAPDTALLYVKRGYALAALRRFTEAKQAFDAGQSLDPAALEAFRRSLAAGREPAPELDPAAIGRVPTQIDYSDYRDVNGVKMPFQWTYGWVSGREEYTMTEYQMNVNVDAARFARPVAQPAAQPR